MSKLMMTHSQRSVQPNKRKKWVSISSYSTLSSSLKPVLMKFFDKKSMNEEAGKKIVEFKKS